MNKWQENQIQIIATGLTGLRSAIIFPALKESRVFGSLSVRRFETGMDPFSIASISAFILKCYFVMNDLHGIANE